MRVYFFFFSPEPLFPWERHQEEVSGLSPPQDPNRPAGYFLSFSEAMKDCNVTVGFSLKEDALSSTFDVLPSSAQVN